MAGHRALKSVSDRPLNQRTTTRRRTNRKLYKELMLISAQAGVSRAPGVTVTSVLQECLERAVAAMRYAAAEVDKLAPDEFWASKVDAQGNTLVEPNKWYQLEQNCRTEVEELASKMVGLDLAERAVAVEEAKALLWYRALAAAARKVGIPPEQLKELGGALREQLTVIEGEATAA